LWIVYNSILNDLVVYCGYCVDVVDVIDDLVVYDRWTNVDVLLKYVYLLQEIVCYP
jgi:hypothetical protein